MADSQIPHKFWKDLLKKFKFSYDEDGQPYGKTVDEVKGGFQQNNKQLFFMETWHVGKFISSNWAPSDKLFFGLSSSDQRLPQL